MALKNDKNNCLETAEGDLETTDFHTQTFFLLRTIGTRVFIFLRENE